MSDIYSKIVALINDKRCDEAYEIAKQEGYSESDWERILTDVYWDWHDEH